MREWSHGDEVYAHALKDKSLVRGAIAQLTWGADKEGNDIVKGCVVYDDVTELLWSVDPATLRYVTDVNGFYFKGDAVYGSITIGRNDDLLLNKTWVAATGAFLIYQSLKGTGDARGWLKRKFDALVTWVLKFRRART